MALTHFPQFQQLSSPEELSQKMSIFPFKDIYIDLPRKLISKKNWRASAKIGDQGLGATWGKR